MSHSGNNTKASVEYAWGTGGMSELLADKQRPTLFMIGRDAPRLAKGGRMAAIITMVTASQNK
jgi:hypothetical protein